MNIKMTREAELLAEPDRMGMEGGRDPAAQFLGAAARSAMWWERGEAMNLDNLVSITKHSC